MSFTSYLVERFNTTHENIFFRMFAQKLANKYDTISGEHVLIGNFSCQGHQVDALFMARGRTIVIDFKDYEGKLTFSDNNPWKLKTKDDLIFVAGGASSRNPFQQVNAYRFALMNYISTNEKEVIDLNHTTLKWDHITCLVLFQRKIEFDRTSIPAKIARYFHIADINTIYALIDDLHSKNIELTDSEIYKIIKLLNVSATNQFNYQESIPEILTAKRDQSKLLIAQNLLKNAGRESRYQNILQYYITLLTIERQNEPTLGSKALYKNVVPNNLSTYALDLTANPIFVEAWQRNSKEKFPQNLFIGLNVAIDDRIEPLLHTVLLYADVADLSQVSINLDEFSIYTKVLESFKLPEDIIEVLAADINKANSLSEKLKCIAENLSVTVKQSNSLTVALSAESMYTAQLISELKSLKSLEDEAASNKLFYSFVTNQAVPHSESIVSQELVQISLLNENQHESVKRSFAQPLTVITGPPGTGKSQVVANIIANAIVNNQSVLFASKNNMAIDNVKDRLDKTLAFPFLIRFGSKVSLEQSTKPAIKAFVSQRNTNPLANTQGEFNKTINELRAAKHHIETQQELVNSIPKLEKLLQNEQTDAARAKEQKNTWLSSLKEWERRLFIDERLVVSINTNQVNLIIQKLNSLNGLLGSIRFYFSKKRLIESITQINEAQPRQLQDIINLEHAWSIPDEKLRISMIRNLEYITVLHRTQLSLKLNYDDWISKEQTTDAKASKTKTQLDLLTADLPKMQAAIEQTKVKLPKLGLESVNYSIQSKLSTLDTATVQNYLNDIPIMMWKNEELLRFGRSNEAFLKNFPTVCVTNLSIKNCFALKANLFDLLIIDEASQCDIASAIPMLFRAKRTIIIGDPLQLKHITSVKEYESDYVKERLNVGLGNLSYVTDSLFSFGSKVANISRADGVFLDEHYRCHPDIISFSSAYFYAPELGQSLEVRTKVEDFHFAPTGVTWININGSVSMEKNINMAEVNKCIAIAEELHRQYPEAQIGIITPFKDQAKALQGRLPDHLYECVEADTVHRFQGDEKDIVIFSTVISDDSPPSKARFLTQNKELINVAITRARSSLIVVGNYDYCSKLIIDKTRTPLANLAEHINSRNRVSTKLA